MANWVQWSGTTGAGAGTAPAKETSREVLIGDLYAAVERDYKNNQRKSVRNLNVWAIHLKPVFGQHPARQFDPELVESYIERRRAAGAAPATINRELAVLKRMASLALKKLKTEDEKLIAALVRWGKVESLAERNVRKGFVKDADYEALARETGRIGLWLRAMFECAYTFGFRKSELLEMKVGQLDLAARTLSLEVGETKNDDARVIDLGQQPKLFELLRECAAEKGAGELLFTRALDASGRKSKLGGRIADFRKAWSSACERAGVPGLLFHDMRRTGVSNMIRDGLDEKVAMTISGHKTRSVFDRYHIVRPEALKDAAIKMARGHRERQRAAVFQAEFFSEANVQAPPDRKPS